MAQYIDITDGIIPPFLPNKNIIWKNGQSLLWVVEETRQEKEIMTGKSINNDKSNGLFGAHTLLTRTN